MGGSLTCDCETGEDLRLLTTATSHAIWRNADQAYSRHSEQGAVPVPGRGPFRRECASLPRCGGPPDRHNRAPGASNGVVGVRGLAVIVPARDAAATLPACLAALHAAGVAPGEVTVCDDGSTDGTGALAARMGARVVSGGGRGAAAARNAAVAGLDADLLVFVDADVAVREDARAAILDAFALDPDCAAIFGAYCPDPPAPGLMSRARNLLHRHVHHAAAGEAETFWTGLGAVRRSDFKAVGGFDEAQRMMEDVAFGMALRRAGRRIRLDPGIEGTHLKRWTLVSMLRSDLFDRAIPWTRLILSAPDGAGAALNVSPAGRRSVLASGAALLGLLGLPVAPLAATGLALVGVGALAASNRAFLSELARVRGPGFAAGALVMLWAHYLAGGAGYAWVRLVERPRPARQAAVSASLLPTSSEAASPRRSNSS